MKILFLLLFTLTPVLAGAQTASPAPDPGPISPAPWVPYVPPMDKRCADTVFYYSNLDICGHLQPAPAYDAALMRCVDSLGATRRDFETCAVAYSAVLKKCGRKCRGKKR